MHRVRQVLLKNVEHKILFSKEHILNLDKKYKKYCENRPDTDEFCKVNYYDERSIQELRIKLYEDKIDHILHSPYVSIVDTEIDIEFDSK